VARNARALHTSCYILYSIFLLLHPCYQNASVESKNKTKRNFVFINLCSVFHYYTYPANIFNMIQYFKHLISFETKLIITCPLLAS